MRTTLLFPLLFTATFLTAPLYAQNGAAGKLHKRLYEHYDQREIDLFKPVDVKELNWYMTQSFIIDKAHVICESCGELNPDTFDVIRYDRMRLDDERVTITPAGMRHPLILFSKNEVLETIREIHTGGSANDTTIFTCSTPFYDPGGPSGNYTVGSDTTITYCSNSPGSCIQVNFNSWGLSDSYCSQHDVLIVYDGPDTTYQWVGDFSTTLNIPSNAPTTITSTSGCLTFQFKVDACSPGDVGWSANLTCVPCPVLPPPQPSCNNVDFEAGSFSGWTGTTGTNYASTWTTGIVANRHTIVSTGNDPCGAFPMSAPGGTYSARLGNNVNGAQSEQLYQRFQVTQSNANFTYQYAAVFENPNHAFFDQPFFKIEVFDDSNKVVQCGYYYVIASDPGFQTVAPPNCSTSSPQVSIEYKPWSFVAINLVPYIGKNVTVRYTTADCSRTGHFGYAYLDCTCNPFQLLVDSVLCPGETATLNGPPGFQSYSWSPGGQTTQNITVNSAGQYCVTVSNGNQNCQSSFLCGTVNSYPAPNAQFTYTPSSPMILEQMPVCFTNQSTISQGTITSYSWNFGDPLSSTDSTTNPCFAYQNRDTFCVRLIATSNMGCRDTANDCLEIVPDSIFIPNVFTPNGDGINDIFTFPNIGYKGLHCDIYNRWGNHMFTWDGVDGGWNGDTPHGKASDGVYYYVMTAERLSGEIVSDHGWVQLLRHKSQ